MKGFVGKMEIKTKATQLRKTICKSNRRERQSISSPTSSSKSSNVSTIVLSTSVTFLSTSLRVLCRCCTGWLQTPLLGLHDTGGQVPIFVLVDCYETLGGVDEINSDEGHVAIWVLLHFSNLEKMRWLNMSIQSFLRLSMLGGI
ncbi:hypothetical protein V6N12_014277 [Hibiscus sabdariffa]|uniref:Uncharacterized protein n=1 Tax=Hibiscus sabdariffa TaxID=183260 RepID=A0ABR2DJP1_9ROSI